MTTTTMDALIVHAPSRYSIERVPVPVPEPYEALCQVRAVAICGTDTHIINGDFHGFWPRVSRDIRNCPETVMRTARWWPSDLPGDGHQTCRGRVRSGGSLLSRRGPG
jgi:hypothetical protein